MCCSNHFNIGNDKCRFYILVPLIVLIKKKRETWKKHQHCFFLFFLYQIENTVALNCTDGTRAIQNWYTTMHCTRKDIQSHTHTNAYKKKENTYTSPQGYITSDTRMQKKKVGGASNVPPKCLSYFSLVVELNRQLLNPAVAQCCPFSWQGSATAIVIG